MTEERVRALDDLIVDTSDSITRTLESIIRPLGSEAKRYRGYRIGALTAVGSIVIPILLALAALGATAPIFTASFAIILSAVSAIVAGILALALTRKVGALENRHDDSQKNFTSSGFAIAFAKTSFRSRLASGRLEDVEIDEFYKFFLVLQAAIKYEVKQIAGKDWCRLEEVARKSFEDDLNFICEQTETWKVFERATAKALLEASETIRDLINRYRAYCGKKRKPRPS